MPKYIVVAISSDGTANHIEFNVLESAIDYGIIYAMRNPMSSCMVYKVDGKKKRLVWSKLEGFVG